MFSWGKHDITKKKLSLKKLNYFLLKNTFCVFEESHKTPHTWTLNIFHFYSLVFLLQTHIFPSSTNSTWTMKFQMFKLDLEKAEEPEIKLPTFIGSSKKAREFQKNIYFCFTDYAKAFDCVDHHKLWKILQEMGMPVHLTCLLRNLYAGQEATVRTGHGTTDCFQIGKRVRQGCILSPCLFNLYAEYIMRNSRLYEV